MTRLELVASLRELARSEDSLVEIYNRHIAAVLQWSGLDPKDRDRARAALDRMRADSEKHKTIFIELAGRVDKGEIDVY